MIISYVFHCLSAPSSSVPPAELESRPQPSRPRTWPPRPSRAKAGWCRGQCQYGLLFSQNFKTQTFIAGLIMTNFILIARFSKLVIKLTVSFSQRTLKYFRPSTCFPRPKPRTRCLRPRPRTWSRRPRT